MAATQTVQIDKALFYDLCARYIPSWAEIYPPKLTDEQLIAGMTAKLDAMAARAMYTQNLRDRKK